MSSLYDRANEVARFAQRKISRLQRAYVGKGSDAARARSALARLRRLGMPGGSSWISVGEDLFGGLLELELSSADEKKAIRAITASLRLYAYHQQSKDHPMAIVGDSRDGRANRRSFGWSCRRIEFDNERSKGVRRRLAAIEGASDIDGAEHYLRSLVMLMRDKDVCVDYYLLTRDLFLIQFPSAHADVFMRWGRDYFTTVPDEKTDGSESDAPDGEKNREVNHVS